MPRERETIESQTRLALIDVVRTRRGWAATVAFDGDPVATYEWGDRVELLGMPRKHAKVKAAMKYAASLAPIVYPDDLEVAANMGRVLEALAERAVADRQTAGLTAGNDRALAALGVERLPEGWVSVTLRFKLPKEEAERARAMSSAERSEALRRGLARG